LRGEPGPRGGADYGDGAARPRGSVRPAPQGCRPLAHRLGHGRPLRRTGHRPADVPQVPGRADAHLLTLRPLGAGRARARIQPPRTRLPGALSPREASQTSHDEGPVLSTRTAAYDPVSD